MKNSNRTSKQLSREHWRKSNPEKVKAYNDAYNKANKDRLKGYRLRDMYNISLEDYNKLFSEQEGKCAICGRHQSEFKRDLNVDHCHTTGKVRGLLCPNCNYILGHSRDNIIILQKSIDYLKKFE